MSNKVLKIIKDTPLSTKEISKILGQKSISGRLYQVINELRKDGLTEWTIQDKPKSSKQKYRITKKGLLFLEKTMVDR